MYPCAKCGGKTRVLNVRWNKKHQETRRRRACNKCGQRTGTCEKSARGWLSALHRCQRAERFLVFLQGFLEQFRQDADSP